jgi:hypothetical protein
MRDVKGHVISITPSKATAVDTFNLAVSESNPLDDLIVPDPAGPDRIFIEVTDPTVTPCFALFPKIFSLAGGYSIPTIPNASRANRKGRTMFIAFQNALRRSLYQRFHQLRGFYKRNDKAHHFKSQLPKHLLCRLDSMISRDMASLLWSTKSSTQLTPPVRFELQRHHEHMANFSIPWECQSPT